MPFRESDALIRVRGDDARSASGAADDAARRTATRAGYNASACSRSGHDTAPIRVAIAVRAAVRADDSVGFGATRRARRSRDSLGAMPGARCCSGRCGQAVS